MQSKSKTSIADILFQKLYVLRECHLKNIYFFFNYMAKQDLKSAVYACENGFGSEYGTRSQNPNALLATSGSL